VNFARHYRRSTLISCICFCCGVGVLTLFASPSQQPQGLVLAIEILPYRILCAVRRSACAPSGPECS